MSDGTSIDKGFSEADYLKLKEIYVPVMRTLQMMLNCIAKKPVTMIL